MDSSRRVRQNETGSSARAAAVPGPDGRPPQGERAGSRRPYREFGAWLRLRRNARGWSQSQLADRLHFDVTYVRKIEWGERPASEAFRARVADVFGLALSLVADASGATSRAHRLEPPANSLIGREDEVAAILGHFERGDRLITLVGAPGVGKTRLALEVASRLDDKLRHGVCVVDMLDVSDPARVAARVARALGLVESETSDPARELLAHLEDQDLLLVLDNLEHLPPAAPTIASWLAGARRLRVLATSREPLQLSRERRFEVGPLAVLDFRDGTSLELLRRCPAVALFVERLSKVRREFALTADNVAVVAAICTRLEGVPLAIELAAANGQLFTPAELLDRLDACLDLPVQGPVDGVPHQRTMRATLQWSYDLLKPCDRALIAEVGVFAGGFSIEAAAEVCQRSGGDLDVAAGLASLVGKSLLRARHDQRGSSRVTALESIRQFALERLAQRGELETLKHRHVGYFVRLAEEAEPRLTGPEQVAWMDVLESEHANLAAAITWATEHDASSAVRLGGALWRFWLRGHTASGRAWLEGALDADTASTPARVDALNGAGVLARAHGDYDAARSRFTSAADLGSRLGTADGLALALLNLGIIEEQQGAYEEASSFFDQSEDVYRRGGLARGIAHVGNCRGMLALDAGRYARAAGHFAQSMGVFRQLGDIWSVALVATNLGWVCCKTGDLAQATNWYEEALGHYRALADDRGIANTLSSMGRVPSHDGGDVAVGLLEEALIVFRRIGDRRGVCECLEAFATVSASCDALERAACLFGAAGALRFEVGSPLWPAEKREQVELLAHLASRLGPQTFEASWRHGARIRVDKAIDLALQRDDTVSAPPA